MRGMRKKFMVISGLYIVSHALWIYFNAEFSILKRNNFLHIPTKIKELAAINEEATCKIPELDPFDPIVLKHYRRVLPFGCLSSRVFFEANYHSEPPSIEPIKKLEEWGNCCYKRLVYQSEYPYRRNRSDQPCIELFSDTKTNISPRNEYVHIFCKKTNSTVKNNNNETLHEEILNFIPAKPSPKTFNSSKPRSESPNVLVIGFDHQSRLNFLRQMPKSYAYVMKELGAIEMLGFTKIGDATFNNTNAFLMGLNYSELRHSCWKNDHSFFDSCPFIWKDFAENGYLTSYSEDGRNVYSYRFRGFRKQPTDYYTNPFFTYRPKIPTMMTGKCHGRKPILLFLHDYIRKMAWTLRSKPYFHFAFQATIHQYISMSALTDFSFEKTLSFLQSKNLLNSTIVILISDHGWRYGSLLHEYQGRLENRLPFAYFIFPTWFKKKYSDAIANMKRNANRLTTPYDVYATMKDLANLTKLSSKSILSAERSEEAFNNRGISLFLPVPLNRTCKSAGIDPHWCTCDSYSPLSPSNPEAKKVGKYVVIQINTWLKGFPLCSQFELKKVVIFEVKSENQFTEVESRITTFRIIISVKPGDGEFEATVFRDGEGKLTMSAEISRVSRYADQSYCVTTYSIKKFCYCKIQKAKKGRKKFLNSTILRI